MDEVYQEYGFRSPGALSELASRYPQLKVYKCRRPGRAGRSEEQIREVVRKENAYSTLELAALFRMTFRQMHKLLQNGLFNVLPYQNNKYHRFKVAEEDLLNFLANRENAYYYQLSDLDPYYRRYAENHGAEEWVTLDSIAIELCMSYNGVYYHLQTGRLKAVRYGQWRIFVSEMERFREWYAKEGQYAA